MDGELHRELAQDAGAMASHEAGQRGLDLEELGFGAILGRQIKEQMAVDDVCVGSAFPAPDGGQATGYSTTSEALIEAFADLGETLAVRIIKGDRPGPVDGCVVNQGQTDCSREIDGLDDVRSLV